MSIIASSLALKAVTEVAKWAVKEYGPAAAESLKTHVLSRFNRDDPEEATVVNEFEEKIAAAIAEARRPMDDYFGPRVGDEIPPDAKPLPTLGFGVAFDGPNTDDELKALGYEAGHVVSNHFQVRGRWMVTKTREDIAPSWQFNHVIT